MPSVLSLADADRLSPTPFLAIPSKKNIIPSSAAFLYSELYTTMQVTDGK
jgi:hypothetical protein